MKLRSAFVTVAAVAVTSTGILAGPSVATTAAPTSSAAAKSTTVAPSTYVKTARKATNQVRKANARSTLKKSACLSRYAKAQATAMARSNSMYHQSMAPIQAGCKMGWVGENVAFGFTDGTSVVDSGWMKSAGHRANLLNTHYKQMGIGAVQSSNGTWYVSQVFGKKA